jgi:hypothetical protein
LDIKDGAPTRPEVAKAASQMEHDLEALFREVLKDTMAAVVRARTPEEALAMASKIMDSEVDLEV